MVDHGFTQYAPVLLGLGHFRLDDATQLQKRFTGFVARQIAGTTEQ